MIYQLNNLMAIPFLGNTNPLAGVQKVFQSAAGGVTNLIGGITSTATGALGGAFDFTKALSTGNFAGLGKVVTNTSSGIFSGVSNSITSTISGITDPFKRVEELKGNLSTTIQNTAKLPTETVNLLNTDKLTSKNFIDAAGKAIPIDLASVKRSSAIDMNLPQIVGCIGDKLKDLLGVFTVSLGIPTLDQFKVPSLTGIGDSISEAFEKTLSDIQNTITGTLNGIEDALSLKFLNMNNQQELGRLTLSKFLGCETDINLTKRDKVDIRKNPGIIETLTDTNVQISKQALGDASVKEVGLRTGKFSKEGKSFEDIQRGLKQKFKNRQEPYVMGPYDLDVSITPDEIISIERKVYESEESDTPD